MKRMIVLTCLVALTGWAHGAEVTVPMSIADTAGTTAPVGTVRIVETRYGLAFYPELSALPPGLHGFHVHDNPSCAPGQQNGAPVAALAAGGHLDRDQAKKHGEPWGDGHLGDLPPLHVGADGSAKAPVLAPRLKLDDVLNRALMVHAGGDNHADHPAPLGGGGARIACGVIGR